MSKILEKIIGILCLILSIITLILAITLTNQDNKYNNYILTDATIINKNSISKDEHLIEYTIEYTIDNKIITKTLKLTKEYEINDEIKIKYSEETPEEITTNTENLSSPIIYIVSILIFILGIFFTFIGIEKIKEG